MSRAAVWSVAGIPPRLACRSSSVKGQAEAVTSVPAGADRAAAQPVRDMKRLPSLSRGSNCDRNPVRTTRGISWAADHCTPREILSLCDAPNPVLKRAPREVT